MEDYFYKCFGGLIDKIDHLFFGGPPFPILQHQTSSFRFSVIKQVKKIDPDFVDHLDLEVFFYFLFNLSLFTGILVTLNYFVYIGCPWMLITLRLMLFLDMSIMVSKIVLLRRLFLIRKGRSQTQNDQLLWLLFHSKAFKFNKQASNFIFSVLIANLVLLVVGKPNIENYTVFSHLMSIVIAFPVFTRIWKCLTKSTDFQGPEALFLSTEKLFAMGVECLEVITFNDYVKKYPKRKYTCSPCPICLQDYKNNSILRVMGCSAAHAFHKICIDKWLLNNYICPVCRAIVLSPKKKQ